ncbi:MAG: hypothetical protein JNL19_07215 [Burkholderiales bacterium]|nr:hypothetical protein [Burkholderiales bacterium]
MAIQLQSRAIFVMAVSSALLVGCASEPRQQVAGNEPARDERCTVTGSNVPKRDCRGDARVLPPAAIETLQPSLAPRPPGN